MKTYKKNLYKDISKIGLFVENEKEEILVRKNYLLNLKKEIFTVPIIDIPQKIQLEDSLKIAFKEYGIMKVKAYINEINILDNLCNEYKQINLYCKSNAEEKELSGYEWIDVKKINELDVPEYIKEAVFTYKYNRERLF